MVTFIKELEFNRSLPDYSDKEFETLDFYVDLAKKTINKNAPKAWRSFILANEDMISNVATSIMFADVFWNGHGNLHGYRKSCGVWAIKGILKQLRLEREKVKFVSYNSLSQDENEYVDILEDNTSLVEDIQNKELKNKLLELLDCGYLTAYESLAIKMYYFLGYSAKDIASHMHVTRQSVYLYINSGIKKLRELHGL